MIKHLPIASHIFEQIAEEFGTPFHLYDEAGIRDNARRLHKAFSWAPHFKEFFAVKALPNPYIMQILAEEGCGADCSSLAELCIAEAAGLSGADICLTSNDTPAEEFIKALSLGAIINLDDISHIEFLEKEAELPEMISFRYNPGPMRKGGNEFIGVPEQAKYGMTGAQLLEAIAICRDKGVKRFGIHTMVVSNELNGAYYAETAEMMFKLAVRIKKIMGISVEIINLGGGIGIPYLPEEAPVDLDMLGAQIRLLYERILVPSGLGGVLLAMENGRLMTGPFGYLAARALHYKDTYKNYIGLDACMADLMRPAIYGAYHHISVCGKEDQPCDMIYDITGSLCENNDKFAIDRALPQIEIGDLLVFHDTGAHGHAMGFNYNGKLRSQELLLGADGKVSRIRRAETLNDYFATVDYPALRKIILAGI
ncbi:MAG: diaminopimelate decarboxylase [Bacillota bacterium]|nr:diaminopimelate decarboxylase [Bacillota bacterium]